MDNLLESLFLCYDNSPDYWEIADCGNRTTVKEKNKIVKID